MMAVRKQQEMRESRVEDEALDMIGLLQYERFRQLENQKLMEEMRSWKVINAMVKTESTEQESHDYLDISLM